MIYWEKIYRRKGRVRQDGVCWEVKMSKCLTRKIILRNMMTLSFLFIFYYLFTELCLPITNSLHSMPRHIANWCSPARWLFLMLPLRGVAAANQPSITWFVLCAFHNRTHYIMSLYYSLKSYSLYPIVKNHPQHLFHLTYSSLPFTFQPNSRLSTLACTKPIYMCCASAVFTPNLLQS